MQLLTKEKQKTSLLPQVSNSLAVGPHTSIFVPVEESDSVDSVHIKFKKLYAEAERLLCRSMQKQQAEDYLKPLVDAMDSYDDLKGINGLGFFKSQDAFYHTSLRVSPPEIVVVAGSFHIKPLLHCISSTSICYVIAVTSSQVKLFKAIGDRVSLLRTYSNEAEEANRNTNDRFVGNRKRTKKFTESFISETAKQLMKDYNLQRKDIAVLGPMKLRHSLISEINAKTQANIFYESIQFSSISEMARSVDAAMKSVAQERSQKFVEHLVQTSDDGLITNSLTKIAEAAVQGRIERLVVDPSNQVWGLYDRVYGLVSTHAVQSSDEDDCVIDDITEEVVKNGGEVVFFDSSTLENIAPYMATLRW